ncbi:STAS domain-containing protein [Actinosynnema sp. NPDC004786]
MVDVVGDLDVVTAKLLFDQGCWLLADGHRDLLLDMSGLTFCDSSGLSTIINLWQRAEQAGGDLALVAITDRLAGMLRVTATDTLITVHPATELGHLAPPVATEPA